MRVISAELLPLSFPQIGSGPKPGIEPTLSGFPGASVLLNPYLCTYPAFRAAQAGTKILFLAMEIIHQHVYMSVATLGMVKTQIRWANYLSRLGGHHTA